MSDLDEEILEELRLTNRLLAQTLIKDASSQTERIVILERCGISPSDVADLLNIKPNVVTAILSRARKAEAAKRKPKPSKISKSDDQQTA